MTTSIFRNFSVDYLRSSATPDFGLGRTPHLFLLAINALSYCGKIETETDGKLKGFKKATDESLEILASKINDLANRALKDQTEYQWVGFEAKTKKSEDCTVFELAFEGLSFAEDNEVEHYQISGMAALWLIDNAITKAKAERISVSSLEELSEAALFLSQAGTAHKDIYRTSAERNEAIRKEQEFIKERSKNAAKNAAKRHANDPKQADKDFVFECWCEWQKKPVQYKSNADFARSMIDKCEHITSHKNITDWCREWKNQEKSVGLQAH